VIEESDARPTQQACGVFKELSAELEEHQATLRAALDTDLVALNRTLQKMHLDPVSVP